MFIKFEGVSGVFSVVETTIKALKIKASSLFHAVGLLVFFKVLFDVSYGYFIYWMFPSSVDFLANKNVFSLYVVITFLFYVINGLFWIFIAVKTHRVLIPRQKITAGSDVLISNFSSYVRFAVRVFLFSFSMFGCMLPLIIRPINFYSFFEGLVSLVLIAASLVLFWYVAHAALILPSVAVRLRMTFSESFDLTRKHQFLMFSIAVLIPFLLAIDPYLILNLFLTSSLLAEIFFSIFSSFLLVFEIALLSVTYIYINKNRVK